MTDAEKAARQGGPCQNAHPYFSNRLRNADAPFDSIAAAIAGQREGASFVRDVRDGIAAPDALFMRLQEIADDAAATRGFCRALQKFIERGTA